MNKTLLTLLAVGAVLGLAGGASANISIGVDANSDGDCEDEIAPGVGEEFFHRSMPENPAGVEHLEVCAPHLEH